jgi:hypothetical protein
MPEILEYVERNPFSKSLSKNPENQLIDHLNLTDKTLVKNILIDPVSPKKPQKSTSSKAKQTLLKTSSKRKS